MGRVTGRTVAIWADESGVFPWFESAHNGVGVRVGEPVESGTGVLVEVGGEAVTAAGDGGTRVAVGSLAGVGANAGVGDAPGMAVGTGLAT